MSAGQLGLVLLLGRLRLLERRLIGTRVDLEKRIPRLDVLALFEVDFDDLSVDPAFDRDHVVGLYRTDAMEENRDILGCDGSCRDRDSGRGRLCRRRRHLGAVVQSPQHNDCQQRKDYDCSDRTPYHPERLRP